MHEKLSKNLQFNTTLLHKITRSCVEGMLIMFDRKLVNITLTVTPEERKALKQIALDNDTTVSALLREWLKEYHENKGDNDYGTK